MNSQIVNVVIDDRVRLMSAVLALTDWPSREQQRQRFRPHVHARRTAVELESYRDHPSVKTLQWVLDLGLSLESVYMYGLNLKWPQMRQVSRLPWAPDGWEEDLADFRKQTHLEAWWAESRLDWQLAQEQTSQLVRDLDLGGFLEPFVGPVDETLVLMPNVSFPSASSVGVRVNGHLVCIAPPRRAWGDNEPWPFDEDPGHIYGCLIFQYGRLLLSEYLRRNPDAVEAAEKVPLPQEGLDQAQRSTWSDQFTALVATGLVALFLEQSLGKPEAQAYILMTERTEGLKTLAAVVHVLKRYLVAYQQGQYESFADYLPQFPTHLRLAQGLSSR